MKGRKVGSWGKGGFLWTRAACPAEGGGDRVSPATTGSRRQAHAGGPVHLKWTSPNIRVGFSTLKSGVSTGMFPGFFMKICLTALAAFSLCAGFLRADYTEVPTITVTASSRTVQNAAIHDALRAEPGILLNSQGGSQNDLSIRGSTFSEAGLSLGGLTLRNPQTEHFNAELPLPAALLSRPSVFTGLANQGGHLAGTAGFDLLPVTGRKQVEAGFGTDHRDWRRG